MTGVFAIQDDICQAIVEKLRVQLVAGQTLVKRYTENVEAYNLYLTGRYQSLKYTAEGLAKGKECYEQAIAVDPNYALAWCGLAEFHWLLGFFGHIPPIAANTKSSQAARKALELDDTLAEAHVRMAVLRASDYDWKGAEREFLRALELDPKSENVYGDYEYFYLTPMGRLDEALAGARRAVELDPLSPFMQWRLGHRYYLTRQWDRAITQFHSTFELDPHYAIAYGWLAAAYLRTGKIDDAIRAIETYAQLMGSIPIALGFLGMVYAIAGRTAEARNLLERLEELAQKVYVLPWSFVAIHFGLGNIDRCFDWVERAFDERDAWILQVHVDPTNESLRSHPRYPALLRKMNLAP